MFTKEMFQLIITVIASWQVIVTTLVILIYISLVSYVARIYGRSRFATSFSVPRRKTHIKAKNAVHKAEYHSSEVSDDDDLGLEEA